MADRRAHDDPALAPAASWWYARRDPDGGGWLTPSADVPVCRDEDPAHTTALDACYPPDYQHPEDEDEDEESWIYRMYGATDGV